MKTSDPVPLFGEIKREGELLYFRHDFEEYEDPKDSNFEYFECQEMLRAIGWEMTEPQIEHDCISGPIKPIAT